MTDAPELAAKGLAEAADLAVWRRARRQLFVPVDIIVLALSVACAAGLRIPEAVQ